MCAAKGKQKCVSNFSPITPAEQWLQQGGLGAGFHLAISVQNISKCRPQTTEKVRQDAGKASFSKALKLGEQNNLWGCAEDY